MIQAIAIKFGKTTLRPTLNPIGTWPFEFLKIQHGRWPYFKNLEIAFKKINVVISTQRFKALQLDLCA